MKCIWTVPTGAGKTYAAIILLKRLLDENPEMRILVIVPKNVILDNWVKELGVNGFSWNKVGIYNKDCKEYSKITITTNSSINKINKDFFDLLIVDEVHNAGTPKMLKILEMPFKFKLGLSATPERSDFNHWQIYKYFDYNVYEYSVKQALQDDVLNKFDFYDVSLELDDKEKEKYDMLSMSIGGIMKAIGGYHAFKFMTVSNPQRLALMKLMGQRKELVWNNEKKIQIVGNLCKKYMEDNSKIIVFSQYNSVTNSLYYHLSSEGLKSVVFHSSIPEKERVQSLKDFESGKVNIMLATKVMDEGVNIPAIDIGIILAGERTKRQTIQRLGRCLRKKEDGRKSKLFQLYFTDTFEQEVCEERTKYFKELSNSYEKVIIED